MLDLRSLTLEQLALVKPHTKANTDQNCSFEKAINYNCAALFFGRGSMLTSFDRS
jgi:hypothetical protein